MDMQLQHIFVAGTKVVVNTGDGSSYVGVFQNYDHPYATFIWDDLGRIIYINTEQICSVYALEDTPVHPDYHQTKQGGRVLGKHTTTTGEGTEPSR